MRLQGPIKRSVRLSLYVGLILAFQLPTTNVVHGQGLWQRFVQWVREGDDIDSVYIYQRPVRPQVSFDGSLQRVGIDLQSDFMLTCRQTGDDGTVTAEEQVPSHVTSSLSENINGGFGMGLAYGKLGLGVGLFTWPANAATTSAFNVGYQGHRWGISLSYYGISQHAANTLTVDTVESSQWYVHDESMTANPCNVGRFAVDAYWTVHRNRFAYTAAYKCDMLQRRSAGSLMICAGLLLSGMEMQAGDAMLLLSDFRGYRSFQSSVGAGYSHNIVFVHRDPTGPNNKGLFNITLNLTILPTLTFLNNIYAVTWSDTDDVQIHGTPTPNVTLRGAVGFSIGRTFFGLQYRHNMFYFHTADAMNAGELGLVGRGVDNVSVSGTFHDWRLSTVFVFNF